MMIRIYALFFILALSLPATYTHAQEESQATVIYLLRHAEKKVQAKDPGNPHLSAAGQYRAKQLVKLLKHERLDAIYSTDFYRTRETVEPLAAAHGLGIATYPPFDLAGFAEVLPENPGRYVVVGHSNTTPKLVQLLGGEPGAPIDDESEFDRLYILCIQSDRPVTTMMLSYGGD